MMIKRLAISIFGILTIILLSVSPVFAIGNPVSIAFGSGSQQMYRAFYNVGETGDMLFVVEGYVNYSVNPTDYTASQAYIFQVLNTAGNSTLVSTPLNEYGDRPISIYLTADQVSALGMAINSAYIMRIMGNPAIFASSTGNSVNATLAADSTSWYNVATDNWTLRAFCVAIAQDIQTHDNPAPPYLISYNGKLVLNNVATYSTTTSTSVTTYSSGTTGNSTASNTTGSQNTTTTTSIQSVGSGLVSGQTIFLAGIPGLNIWIPDLFAAGAAPIAISAPSHTGAYGLTLTPLAALGSTTDNAIGQIGIWLGTSKMMAGGLITMILTVLVMAWLWHKTQSGLVVIVLGGAMPLMCTFFGLVQLALAFTATIAIVLMMGYYFFTRGIL